MLFLLLCTANKLEVLMPVEIRIEELRHRLHIESAVCEGAKNAVNILQTQKTDKKALQQVYLIEINLIFRLELHFNLF